jgi:hypothetical protein
MIILLYPIYGVVLPFCFILDRKNREKTTKICFFAKTGGLSLLVRQPLIFMEESGFALTGENLRL